MPFVKVDGVRIFYRLEGNDDKPVLVLSHSLGADHGMWDSQVRDLLPYFRILRYDTRGHGASDVPTGEYSLDGLGRDVVALADALRIEQFAFCGISMGGSIGQWLATSTKRVTHLILANTSPRMDAATLEARRRTVLENGMTAVADAAVQRFFSPAKIARKDPEVASIHRTLLSTDPAGYAGCLAALRDMDQTPSLSKIQMPALIIAGDQDVSMPWAGHGEVLARGISSARVVHLPSMHLSNLERPRSFNQALLNFLLPRAGDPLEAGFATRRDTLGSAYVDAAIARTTDFTRDFQELITCYAWGSVWSRPGLDRRTRRLLVLTATAALGRWEAFRTHVRAGLANELESSDIKEALLQAGIYAGLPAANTGFKIASEEIDDACAPKSG